MNPFKIVVIGSTGMLGADMVKAFRELGAIVSTPSRRELDLGVNASILSFFNHAEAKFDLVVNCSGFTQVDDCETQRELAYTLNAHGVKILALVCQENALPLLHFSTDYIFDGTQSSPYTENATPHPLNHYGATKLAGEQGVFESGCTYYLFRVQWLYGHNGHHFPKAIMPKLLKNEPLSIVDDQFGAPTWTLPLARSIAFAWLNGLAPGLYNLSTLGVTSWYGFACFMAKQLQSSSIITPISTSDLHKPAKRPSNSRLDLCKAIETGLFKGIETWEATFLTYLKDEL